MKTFKDTATNQYWQFDDHDDVRLIDGIYYVFDVNGVRLTSVPETLEPSELPEPPTPTLDDLKGAKIVEINTAFTEAAQALTDGYPEAERMTWATQQSEVMAWAVDTNAPTPYLDGLAAARGITPEEMRQKTLEQTQLFMAASQQLVGTRQRLRDLVHDAQTPEALDTINWPA